VGERVVLELDVELDRDRPSAVVDSFRLMCVIDVDGKDTGESISSSDAINGG
jgi:hypothetical protein